MARMTQAGYIPPAPAPEPPKPGRQDKPEKKKRGRMRHGWRGISGALIASLVLLLTALLLCAGMVFIYLETELYKDTFAPGTWLGDHALAGMGYEQAQKLLNEMAGNAAAEWRYTITWGDHSWTIAAEDVALSVDEEETLRPLWTVGRDGNLFERFAALERSRMNGTRRDPVIRRNEDAIDTVTRAVALTVDRAPVDATVSYQPGSSSPFVFTDDAEGYSVDVPALSSRIRSALSSLTSVEEVLEPKAELPKVTRKALEDTLRYRGGVTMALPKDEAQCVNISLSAALLNGVSLKPGESLSFNRLTGNRTAEGGYVEAPEPAYGSGVSGVGGGICFTSSALYQAALLSGLTVSEWHAAARPVQWCDAGLEAAVSGQLDLVIENPTGQTVFMLSRIYTAKEQRYLEIQIFGEELPFRYALKASVEDTGVPEEPLYIRDKEGVYATYRDERVPVGEAQAGCVSTVTRIRLSRPDGAEGESEIVSETVYEAVPQKIYVGAKDR